MGVFHVFKIIQMQPNCATHNIHYKLGQACITNGGRFVSLEIATKTIIDRGKIYYKLGYVLPIKVTLINWRMTLITLYMARPLVDKTIY